MQHHAIHVRVIKVEHMAHLPVHQRRFQHAHFVGVPDDLHLGQAAGGVQRRLEPAHGVGVAARQCAAQPIEQAALAFVPYFFRQLFVLEPGREVAE